jgi:hypothetical protein
MASTLALLQRLLTEKVEFVLVGGLAAIAHGSATTTHDADVCVRFDETSVRGILRALAGLNPRHRMTPQKLPLGDDPLRYVGNRNLYVVCDEGIIDFLGELTGVGDFARINASAVEMQVSTFSCRVISLDDLILSKRSVGRPKDKQVARELELVRERFKKP